MSKKLAKSVEQAMLAHKGKLSWATEQAYTHRLEYIRNAREKMRSKDYAMAMHYYHSYLNALAMYYDTDVSNLKPELLAFNQTEQYEFIIVTFVYWELAKIYDRFPDDIGQTKYCLRQMCHFARGHKIQKIIASAMRKYIRKKQCKNISMFEEFYSLIKTDSVPCYVATYCYGEEDLKLTQLRLFREKILHYKLGILFVRSYYKISPLLIAFCQRHKYFSIGFKKVATICLNFFLRFLKHVNN